MLQSIRDKTSGWIASVILVLIMLTMVFFGIENYLQPKIENYAAKVESPPRFWKFGVKSREITQDEFRTRFEQVRQQQREQQGDKFDAAGFESIENKRLVLDQLVDEAVLELVAERDGVAVSKAQLQATIADVPSFQVAGKFNPETYLLALKTRGQSAPAFEDMVRKSLVRELFPDQISASALAGDAELDAYLRLAQQTRHVKLLEVPPPTDPLPPPTDAEIKAWYDAHAAQYRSPESVTIDYIELDGAKLPPASAPSENDLLATYESEKARFGMPEQRVASHILVQVPADAPAAAWDAAKKKATDVAAKARAPGADFAALARQYSDDIGTKDAGGDLGAIEPPKKGAVAEDATAQLAAAAFALESPGQVSDPVRTSAGWHVVQFRQLLPGTTKPFAEVRAQLEAEYAEHERDRAFNDASGHLIDAVYKTPTSIAAVAKEAGLAVQHSTPFSRDHGDGVAALDAVRKAAFEEDQKLARQVSEPVEVGPSQVVVLQVVDHRPESAQPLAQVRDRVIADLGADRMAKATKAHAEKLLARAQAGESIDALAGELLRTVADVPAMSRTAPNPQLESLVATAFELPRPQGGKVEYGLAHAAPGQYALVGVLSVQDGDPALIDKDTRVQLRTQLAQARGMEDARAFVRALRKGYKVTIVEEKL